MQNIRLFQSAIKCAAPRALHAKSCGSFPGLRIPPTPRPRPNPLVFPRTALLARSLSYSCPRTDHHHHYHSLPTHTETGPAPLNTSHAAPATTPQSELTFQPSEPRLSLTFTCTVIDCGTRSTHEFAKSSYQKGIVIVKCPGCENRHLIADHLGWFKESMEDGKLKTVEDLMQAKGEKVRRGRLDVGGVVEYTPE